MARTNQDIQQIFSSVFRATKDNNYDPMQVKMLRTYPDYVKRVGTYTSINWHSKPPCLSPPICALYGWSLACSNVLKCYCCGEVLNGELPDRSSSGYAHRLEKLLKNLINCHSEICIFSKSMEPVGFLTNVSSSFQFWNRLYTFEGLHSDQLPKLPKIDIDNSQIEKCYDSVNLSLSMEAFQLALFGWKYRNNELAQLVCEDDNRSIPVRV